MYVSAGLPQQGFYRRNVGARLGTYIRLMLVSLTCLSRTQLSYADEGDLTKVGQVFGEHVMTVCEYVSSNRTSLEFSFVS